MEGAGISGAVPDAKRLDGFGFRIDSIKDEIGMMDEIANCLTSTTCDAQMGGFAPFDDPSFQLAAETPGGLGTVGFKVSDQRIVIRSGLSG